MSGTYNRDVDALDAYGHLNWTVGNEDWLACLDARRNGDQIEYRAVVNCEGGGWVDTIEHGTVPMTVEGTSSLLCFPSYWADICSDHYADSEDPDHRVDPDETERTRERWESHIRSLLADGPCRADHYCGCCSECLTVC